MSRSNRLILPGFPHHITQRGNRKTDVFIDDSDRLVYIQMLTAKCLELEVRVWAYCLMGNHVHLIVVPGQEKAVSRTLQRVHGDYAGYFNFKYGKSGHLWQGRFRSSILDERHLWYAVRYVERNPVRAGMVKLAQDYAWSSAAAHCGLRTDCLLSNDLPLLQTVENWSHWLAENQTETVMNFIRDRTRTGRPCADDEFLKKLEINFGKKLF